MHDLATLRRLNAPRDTADAIRVERDKLRRALELALVAMGHAGANADINHAQREAWEAARKALEV